MMDMIAALNAMLAITFADDCVGIYKYGTYVACWILVILPIQPVIALLPLIEPQAFLTNRMYNM